MCIYEANGLMIYRNSPGATAFPTSPRQLVLISLLALLVLALGLSSAAAQEPTLDEINEVARELYCPLCNGVRLDTCDLQACIQMRQVIAEKLEAGVPKEQIKREFVAQYGPIVLGEPPRQGLNLLGWVLPVAALALGAGWLLYTIRRWTRQPASAASEPAPTVEQQPAATAAADDSDTYLSRVEAELAELD